MASSRVAASSASGSLALVQVQVQVHNTTPTAIPREAWTAAQGVACGRRKASGEKRRGLDVATWRHLQTSTFHLFTLCRPARARSSSPRSRRRLLPLHARLCAVGACGAAGRAHLVLVPRGVDAPAAVGRPPLHLTCTSTDIIRASPRLGAPAARAPAAILSCQPNGVGAFFACRRLTAPLHMRQPLRSRTSASAAAARCWRPRERTRRRTRSSSCLSAAGPRCMRRS